MNTKWTLYLASHAHAFKVGERGITHDYDRTLTERGIKQAELVGSVLGTRSKRPKLVLSSPSTRSIETAKIIMKKLGLHGVPMISRELLSFAEPSALWYSLVPHMSKEPLLLVGHRPILTAFTAWLLGGSGGYRIAFDYATIACFNIIGATESRPQATLSWLLPNYLFEDSEGD